MKDSNVSVIRWMGRGLVVFTALVWLACAADGDVARTMMCPEGETCTDPLIGAEFGGMYPSDELTGLLPTAVGGRQEVAISDRGFSSTILPVWHAVSSDPSVFVVESQTPTSVTLLGVGPGSGFLRVLDESEDLIDRLPSGAEHIDRAELAVPRHSFNAQSWDGQIVFMRGSEQEIVAALFDSRSGRLVDRDASFVMAEGVVPSGWDMATVTFPMTGDVFPLVIETGAGAHLEIEVPLVGEIDRIQRFARLILEDPDAPITFRAERSELFCFISTLGDAAVFGTTLTVRSDEPLTVESRVLGAQTCLELSAEVPGEYALELTGPGAAVSFNVVVGAARP